MKKNKNIMPGQLDNNDVPSPLAAVIFGAIFANEDVSDLAIESFINAVLSNSTLESPRISKVIRVTPEKTEFNLGPDARNFRLDVEARTDKNEVILIEVQLTKFVNMATRNLLYLVNTYTGSAEKGELIKDVVDVVPRVIIINLLDYVMRESSPNFHQVGALYYHEMPSELIVDNFELHILQLTLFMAMEPDLKNPLHLWLIAICRAHYGKRSIKEVVNMDAALKNFYETDRGFAQFVDRFDLVVADKDVIRHYKEWCANELVFRDAVRKIELRADARIAEVKDEADAMMAEVKDEADARVAEADARIAEAEASKELELAKNALRQVNQGQSFTDAKKFLRSLGISEEVIKVAVTEVNNERSGKK